MWLQPGKLSNNCKKFMPRNKTYIAEPGSSVGNRTGSWRTEKPVFLNKKCTDCKLCIILCPDGVVFAVNKVYQANLDFCKGCGICAEECPTKDIQMVRELK